MKRLDLALVDWGFAPSRAKAQQMLENGEVEVLILGHWQKVSDKSYSTEKLTQDSIRLTTESSTIRYVSRGGLKLEAALKHLQLIVAGYRALDIGQSTGGFSDCLLQAGVMEIFGIDVGHDQLHEKIKSDRRVIARQGLHVKDLLQDSEVVAYLGQGIDLMVMDLSFISTLKLLPAILEKLAPFQIQRILLLIKPQFEGEAGSSLVEQNDAFVFDLLRRRAQKSVNKSCFSMNDFFPSVVRGAEGTQEYFAYLVKSDLNSISDL